MMLMFIIHISFATSVIKVVNGVRRVSMQYGLDVDIAKFIPYWIYLEMDFSEHFYVCLALFVFEFVFVFVFVFHTIFWI